MPTVKHRKKDNSAGRSPIRYALYSLYFLIIAVFIGYHLYFADKIIHKVTVNGRDLSALTTQEAIEKVKNEFPTTASIKLKVGESFEKDIQADDINFKYLPVETTAKAFEVGREPNFIESLTSRLMAIFNSVDIQPEYTYDERKMEMLLTSIKKEAGLMAEETHFEMLNGELTIIEGTVGKSFDDASAQNKILAGFASEDFRPIEESLFEINPQFTVSDLDGLKAVMEEQLNVGYVFKYESREWPVTKEEMISMMDVKKDESGNLTLELNDMELAKKLSVIAKELDRSARGQVLEVENGKAVKFVSSENGLRLKVKETSAEAARKMISKEKEIPISVQVATAPESENEFGIEELIGVGTSKFKGSIPGRVHNIGLASSRVSGILVPPGETFSFVETVGEISRDTGYTSAYVISAGRTVLGDGGGVCQVSTTLFRAALNAGLPIVERNAHSYRVAYYEQDSPVGIDAAIYSPSVDLQFRNDTPGYILITSEFDEANSGLAFKIYGTKDGREVEISEPKVLSRTPPPEPVYEEDATLAKGQTKQVETAVWGASVSFGRVVKKDGEVISDDTFKSNYRAWRAIYKVGTRE